MSPLEKVRNLKTEEQKIAYGKVETPEEKIASEIVEKLKKQDEVGLEFKNEDYDGADKLRNTMRNLVTKYHNNKVHTKILPEREGQPYNTNIKDGLIIFSKKKLKRGKRFKN